MLLGPSGAPTSSRANPGDVPKHLRWTSNTLLLHALTVLLYVTNTVLQLWCIYL